MAPDECWRLALPRRRFYGVRRARRPGTTISRHYCSAPRRGDPATADLGAPNGLADLIGGLRDRGRASTHRTAAQIESAPMPGALNALPDHDALGQWTAPVTAPIAQCERCGGGRGNGDGDAIGAESADGARWLVGHGRRPIVGADVERVGIDPHSHGVREVATQPTAQREGTQPDETQAPSLATPMALPP